MMKAGDIALRILASLPGAMLLLNGLGVVFNPARTFESLGMPLLGGIGLSTQIGDLGAFFLGTATFIFIGALGRAWRWLLVGALMLLLAAVLRFLAFTVHGAELAVVFIAVESLLAVWLIGFGWWFARSRQSF